MWEGATPPFKGDSMKEFRVMARSATIRQGFVKLDKNQIRRRKHLIEAVKDGNGKVVDGLFKVLKPCTFKNNETFSYDGEVNKMLLMEMEDVEEAAKKKKAKKKDK